MISDAPQHPGNCDIPAGNSLAPTILEKRRRAFFFKGLAKRVKMGRMNDRHAVVTPTGRKG
jgi:hypothetical protein